MEPEQCNICRFGRPNGDVVICKRFPPNSDGKADSTIDHQPTVQPFGWCGEFKKK